MQTAQLKEYLGMLVDLEKQVYTQDRMIATLKSSISSMTGEKTVYEMPEEEVNDQTWGKWFLHSLPFLVMVVLSIWMGLGFMANPALIGSSSKSTSPFLGMMMWGGAAVFAWLDMVFVSLPPSEEEKRQAKEA